MTSANVTLYRIEKDGDKVGEHRQHHYCKTRWDELLRFTPVEDHTITPHGLDEYEAPWEGEPQNLRDFLTGKRVSLENVKGDSEQKAGGSR